MWLGCQCIQRQRVYAPTLNPMCAMGANVLPAAAPCPGLRPATQPPFSIWARRFVPDSLSLGSLPRPISYPRIASKQGLETRFGGTWSGLGALAILKPPIPYNPKSGALSMDPKTYQIRISSAKQNKHHQNQTKSIITRAHNQTLTKLIPAHASPSPLSCGLEASRQRRAVVNEVGAGYREARVASLRPGDVVDGI